ncbi:MAG: hypothetical protein ABIR84_10645, partial [Candidatus Nitrotoga sp.]
SPSPLTSSSSFPSSNSLVLSWDSYGSIYFGSTLAEAEQLLGPRLQSTTPLDPSCWYAAFQSLPGVRFMVENGVITRAEAEPGVPTSVGVRVGAALLDIKVAHPAARTKPHKYDPEGHYVVFPSPDGKKAIVMEESRGSVLRIRAGLKPSVEYVEGCL